MEKIYKDKKLCNGCSSCSSSCPVGAITMKKTNKGTIYPEIDNEKCIDCNLCQKNCYTNSIPEKKEPIEIYAAKNNNKEVLKNSSSGGLFFELASNFINDNESVYAVKWTDNLEAEYSKIKDIDDISEFMGSKYVQPKLKDTFKKIRLDLKNNKKVLFVGLPCYVQGLYSFLQNRSTENLYTCDLVCHGMPNFNIFEEYKDWIQKKYNSKIVNYKFRVNENSNNNQNYKIEFKNGKVLDGYCKNDLYYSLFLKDLTINDNCYSCMFNSIDRISDITMGDFWGIEKVNKEFATGEGTSLILINTDKGRKLFEKVSDNFDLLKVKKEQCLQRPLRENLTKPIDYDSFWNMYYKKGFYKAANFYGNMSFKNKVIRKISRIIKK